MKNGVVTKIFCTSIVSYFSLNYKLRQLASWSQLDRPHVVACLRSLTLKEAELLPSLNRVFLGTKHYGRIEKRQFTETLE